MSGQLAHLEPNLEGIIRQLHEGFQLLDRDYRYLYLNDAALAQSRRPADQILGYTLRECYPGIEDTPFFAALERCLEQGESAFLENEFQYPDNSRASFELRVHPCAAGVVILSTDITSKNELRAQLRQAQKLEAVGRLASGVAHDFNNLITVIGSFTTFALEGLGEPQPALEQVRHDLSEVRRATGRASDLTRRLLAFTRQKPIRVQRANLNSLVGELYRMLVRIIGDNLRIVLNCAPDLWDIHADLGSLEQVVMNLVVNARDAMPSGGTLTLETYNLVNTQPLRVRSDQTLAPGEYVVVAVTDTGIGIRPENLEHIFEPFYTTKPQGEGTGLGLPICLGIVEQAGGHIGLLSEVGLGTTFQVYLPRAEASPLAITADILPRGLNRGAQELIAIFEEDPQMRQLIERSLKNAGYRVVTLEQAPSSARELQKTGVALLITNLSLNKFTGPKLAQLLREHLPTLRVLYVSGEPNAPELNHPADNLLHKPFTPSDLLNAVRTALDDLSGDEKSST